MNRKLRSLPPQPVVQTAGYSIASITSISEPLCVIEIAGITYPATIATHLLNLRAGQRVGVLDGGDGAGWLVIAAWPQPDQLNTPIEFDSDSGTLRIQAARLNLSALATIELSCGDARIRLSVDGKAHIEGAEIVSAAIGSNRIEGASIDLN